MEKEYCQLSISFPSGLQMIVLHIITGLSICFLMTDHTRNEARATKSLKTSGTFTDYFGL